MTWLVRDDDVLAVAEVAASRRNARAGLIGPRRPRGRARAAARAARCTRSGCGSRSTSRSATATGIVLHMSTLAPAAHLAARLALARSRSRRGPGSFERWKLRPGDVVEIKG